jgi:TPR repeat protein
MHGSSGAEGVTPVLLCETTSDLRQQLEFAFRYAQASEDVKARQCLEISAAAGSARAQLELAMYHLVGKGGAGEGLAALEWLERAAEGGNETAQKMRKTYGGGLTNTAELKRTAKRPSDPSRLTFLIALIPVAWLWLGIGNRSPWPWKWNGRR